MLPSQGEGAGAGEPFFSSTVYQKADLINQVGFLHQQINIVNQRTLLGQVTFLHQYDLPFTLTAKSRLLS